jgi:hypothetical protein
LCAPLTQWLDARAPFQSPLAPAQLDITAIPEGECQSGAACTTQQQESFWGTKWQSFQGGAGGEEACRWRAAVETNLITNDRAGFDTFFAANTLGLGSTPAQYQTFYNEWRLAWFGPQQCSRGSVFNPTTNTCQWTLGITPSQASYTVARGSQLTVSVTTDQAATCEVILPEYYVMNRNYGNWWTYINSNAIGVANKMDSTGGTTHSHTVAGEFLAPRSLTSVAVGCVAAEAYGTNGPNALFGDAPKNAVVIPLTISGAISTTTCDASTRNQLITFTGETPSLTPIAGYKIAAGWDNKHFCCRYGELAGSNGCNGVQSYGGTPAPLCDKGLEGQSCNTQGADYGYICTGGTGPDAKCCPKDWYWVTNAQGGGSCQQQGCIGAGVRPQGEQMCCDDTARLNRTNQPDVCWYSCDGQYAQLAEQLGVSCVE